MTSTSNDMAASRHMIEKLLEAPRLSADRLRVLQGVFDRLASSCTEAMRQLCPAPTSFFVNQIDVGLSWDLLESYEDSIGVVFYCPEWDTRILIGVDRRFAFSLIDAMYGGDGTEMPFETDRPFTTLEARVAKQVCEIAANALRDAFDSLSVKATFKAEKVAPGLEFSILGSRNVLTVTTQMLFQVLDNGGRMFLLIPQSAVYPLRDQLARERAPGQTNADPRWNQKLKKEVVRTSVPFQAALEEQTMWLWDIANLQVGQILELQATAQSFVMLECNGEPLFRCKLAQAAGKFTLIVDSPVDQKDAIIDEILLKLGPEVPAAD